jgi:hypothetical protein
MIVQKPCMLLQSMTADDVPPPCASFTPFRSGVQERHRVPLAVRKIRGGSHGSSTTRHHFPFRLLSSSAVKEHDYLLSQLPDVLHDVNGRDGLKSEFREIGCIHGCVVVTPGSSRLRRIVVRKIQIRVTKYSNKFLKWQETWDLSDQ